MMFETLVSSRIRRALLEHILTHPDGRFYLRGLAKELSLAISPVRRELQRLEQLGLLRSYHEANIRFYVIDHASPHFAQLGPACAALGMGSETSQSAASHQPATASARGGPGWSVASQADDETTGVGSQQRAVDQVRSLPAQPVVAPAPACPINPEALSASAAPQIAARQRAIHPRLGTWVFVSLSLAAVAMLAIALHRSLLMMSGSVVPSWQAGRHAQIDLVRVTTFEPAASGEMRGNRWRLLPGVMGGFTSTTSNQQNH